MRRSVFVSMAAAILFATAGVAPAAAADPNPKAEAEISVAFSADCLAFTAASSKDISYVEISFAGGAVVKDESTTTPSYAYAGTDVIASAVVKSGRTVQTFACVPDGEPDHGQD